MTAGGSLRAWVWVHRWTSLVSTVFLLILCVTGLPLIYHSEIDRLFGFQPTAAAGEGKPLSIEKLVSAAERASGDVVQFVVWDEDKPGLITMSLGRAIASDPSANHSLDVDVRTGGVVAPKGPMEFVRVLHGQLFLGPFGPLALGLVTCLFLGAIVSGVVVYAPFMRRMRFGAVRMERARRTRWLDLHNLVGIVIAGWMSVVGFTGMMNTWGTFVIDYWRNDQLAQIIGRQGPASAEGALAPPGLAVLRAREAAPGMKPYFMAMPGSVLTSSRHYAVFMRGDTPLTSRLVTPILTDAITGQTTPRIDLPTYVKVMFLAEPLHFGDYGGQPLKLLWALLDLLTIWVLISGLYLWWRKRGSQAPAMLSVKFSREPSS